MPHPLVSGLLIRQQDLERLVDADDVGKALQRVPGQNGVRVFLPFEDRRAGAHPSRAICSSVESFQSCAMRKNVRSAGPDNPFRTVTETERAPGGERVRT